MNVITTEITAWPAIVAVPTFITGFYGMNVPYPGFSKQQGFAVSVAVKQSALSARRCVVACDSSRIGKVGFARIGGLGVAATLVTDAAVADADRAWMTEAGLDVAVA